MAIWTRRQTFIAVLVAVVILAAISYADWFAAHPGHRTRGITNLRQMRAVVAETLPAGLSLTEAERRMEREGFRCSKSSSNELYCDRIEGGLFSPVKRKWQVIVSLKGDRVADATVTTGLIGP